MIISLFSSTISVNFTIGSSIKSLSVSNEVYDYSKRVFPIHINALITVGEYEGSTNDYSLGSPFTVLNPSSNDTIVFFPVIYGEDIVALFKVNDDNGELSASLLSYFVFELKNLLLSNIKKEFILLTDGIVLQAYDGQNYITIYKLFENNNPVLDLSQSINNFCQNFHLVNYNDLVTPIKADGTYSINSNVPVANIIESKTLNVKGVSQGNHPWCWAATCAALINYLKGYSLTASSIANYVYPNNPEQGASWTEIRNAYNHWGLSVVQSTVINFGSVRNIINSGKPMHLGLTGHSVALIGFTYTEQGGIYERILILLEPNGGVKKSVTLKSNNNFDYELSGTNSWKYTRTFQ